MLRPVVVCFLLAMTTASGQTLDRMFFDVRFQYQFWDTKINNLQQTVDGVEKIYTEDDIARMSEGLRFHTTFMRVGVDIGYEVLEDLDVEVGGGLAFVNHQSNHDNPGESHELVTRKPGLYGSLASHYTVPILGKLSVTFSPDITYYSTDDLHGVGQNTDAIGLADCDFDHALIDWRARVFFGYDLDWITLYAGAMYNDYTEKMKYKGKTSPDAFGDVYAVDRTLTYAPFSHVGAVLGTGVELGGKKQLWVEVVVGRIVDLRTKIRVLF